MLALLGALACVVANGFFVAAEFALAKVRPTQLEARIKATDDPAAKRALAIVQMLDAYLPATQLGITLASLGLGWLGEPAIAALLAPLLALFGLSEEVIEGISVAVGFALMSSLHIVIGELVPKSLAIRRPEDIARYASLPLRVFYFAVYPALILLNSASKLVLRALGLPAPDHAEGKLSLEELRLLIQASFDDLETQKRELLERVLRATDRPVRAIMVPRVDMEVLSLSDDFDAWMERVRKTGFSRYPVGKDRDPDHVVGYVYVKDLIFHGPSRPSPAALKRDILIVPESRTVGEILAEFKESSIPMALVVDEYGGTSGLVTVEDALAEIVGDMNDELTGVGQPRVVAASDGAYVVDGALPLDDLGELDGLALPERGDAATVGGYVLGALGRLAVPGDRVDAGRWEIHVEDVRARRVHRVRIVPRRPSAPAEPPSEA
ncbi:MAG: hemolysin family protein [Sandaracinus sp.]